MSTRFKSFNHSITNIGYHIIWIPKYREKVLKSKIKNVIFSSLREEAKKMGIKIEKIEIMPDHVHLFIKGSPTYSISKIVQMLKGYSSFNLRRTFPKLKKYKCFWAPSYYCETVGHISESTIKKYIDDQWKK